MTISRFGRSVRVEEYHNTARSRVPRSVLVMLVCWCVAGCMGGTSQDDMLRHAIKRSANKPDRLAAKAQPDQHAARLAKTPDAKSATKAPVAPDVKDAKPTHRNVAGMKGRPGDGHSSAESALSVMPAPVPRKPLDLFQRRQRTIENMTRIGTAIRKYTAKNGRLFAPYIYNRRQQRPVLSWRVQLLPYLGHEALYQQFHLNESWDSPHNKQLLKLIPPEYQSPERFDTNTNYLVPQGTSTAFHGWLGLRVARIEDGLVETVAVVEVDADAAVPWTQPAELDINLLMPRSHVGNLRQDGFFVVYCGGTVSLVANDATPADLAAIWTADKSDTPSFSATHVKPVAEPVGKKQDKEAVARKQNEKDGSALASLGSRDQPANNVRRNVRAGVVSPGQTRALIPVPNAPDIAKAKDAAETIYRQEYDAARKPQARAALAKKLLRQAERLDGDPAGKYVLLDLAMVIASRAGDGTTAIAASDQIVSHFDVDQLELKRKLFMTLVKMDRSRAGLARLLNQAQELIDIAFERDAFEVADDVCQVASIAATKLNDRAALIRLRLEKTRIRDARGAYARLRRMLIDVPNTDDAQTNLKAGQYYCLLKGDWQRGLPLLVKGGDPQLSELAERELSYPTGAREQMELGDGWWELAKGMSSGTRALHLHAALWYLRALVNLPDGLEKIKAEMRVQQITSMDGQDAIDRLKRKDFGFHHVNQIQSRAGAVR